MSGDAEPLSLPPMVDVALDAAVSCEPEAEDPLVDDDAPESVGRAALELELDGVLALSGELLPGTLAAALSVELPMVEESLLDEGNAAELWDWAGEELWPWFRPARK